MALPAVDPQTVTTDHRRPLIGIARQSSIAVRALGTARAARAPSESDPPAREPGPVPADPPQQASEPGAAEAETDRPRRPGE